MSDSTADSGRGHALDRGKNTRRNRSQRWEWIDVEGFTRADGTRVKGYSRRPPIR